MVATRKLEIQVTGDTSGAARVFREIGDGADRTESRLGRWAKGVAAAFAAGFAIDAVVNWGQALIGAAEEAQAVTRQTDAVIASMGASSWTTADAVAELAEQISLKTGLDDEMIQSAQNVLLTFGKVRDEVGEGNDVFTRATEVATDMSVALGQDLQSSVTQIGKALNDPIAGLTSLTRVGVQFTDEQKNMIATLVEAGDTLGAQKIILEELERQFGGSAEAQATASGKMKVAWDNLVETLGTYLLPAFTALTDWLTTSGIPWFESFAAKVADEVGPALSDLWTWIQTSLLPALGDLAAKVRDELLPVWHDFTNWVATSVIPNLKAIWAVVSEELVPALSRMWQVVRNELLPPLRDLGAALGNLLGLESSATASTNDLRDSWSWLAPVIRAAVLQFEHGVTVIGALVGQLGAVVRAADRAKDAISSIKLPGGVGGWDLFGPLPGILSRRAEGGSVIGGRSYLVGEDGPELFTAGQNGMITANDATLRLAGAGGGTVNHFHIAGSILTERDLLSTINAAMLRGRRLQDRGRGL